jgi:TonB family protein
MENGERRRRQTATHRARWFALVLVLGVLGACASQNRPVQLLSGSGPVYPPVAKAAGTEGVVVVRYGIAADGRVINAQVDSAEPEGVFEEAALKAVRSWRYNPALRNGEPVPVDNVVSRILFKLDDGDAYEHY